MFKQWVVLCGVLATVVLSSCNQTASDSSTSGSSLHVSDSSYANDFGPNEVDVSTYPPELQTIYKTLVLTKCATCHKASRVFNSQFVEPSGPKEKEQDVIARWKKQTPEIFQDKGVWRIEGATASSPGIWETYVKRMASKPGSIVRPYDAKQIWEFLRYDSERRKTGTSAKAWAEQRRALLAKFKAEHPDRYRELYEVP